MKAINEMSEQEFRKYYPFTVTSIFDDDFGWVFEDPSSTTFQTFRFAGTKTDPETGKELDLLGWQRVVDDLPTGDLISPGDEISISTNTVLKAVWSN